MELERIEMVCNVVDENINSSTTKSDLTAPINHRCLHTLHQSWGKKNLISMSFFPVLQLFMVKEKETEATLKHKWEGTHLIMIYRLNLCVWPTGCKEIINTPAAYYYLPISNTSCIGIYIQKKRTHGEAVHASTHSSQHVHTKVLSAGQLKNGRK